MIGDAWLAHFLRRLTGRPMLAGFVVVAALAWCKAEAANVESFDLSAYRGKVVLLDFWASWCGPCKESFPWMQRLEERFGTRGLVVIAVNVDRDRQLADRFLQALQPHFLILFDPHAQLAERFQVSGMPESYYIDRTGKVRHTHLGFRTDEREAAEREVEALLAEQEVEGAR